MGMRGERQRERDACDHNMTELGDVEEVLFAALAIGNDQPQHISRGSAQPESRLDGFSKQHMTSLRRWPETDNPNSCRTLL